MKHVEAVLTAIENNPISPSKKGETLRESFKDIANYAGIGVAMLEEEDNGTSKD
jgi:hypothetical protein